jgi:disulfide bond formation protein DsbB
MTGRAAPGGKASQQGGAAHLNAHASEVSPVSIATSDARWSLLFSAWLIALVATLGALFSSEIMGLEPCVLCWYHRIAMFPLALMLGLALLPFDARVVRYALPLALAGAATAAYHTLLVWGLVPKDLVPCGQGPSCAEVKFELLGFINLPLLSLTAFALIVILLWTLKSRNSG